ncbi:MAG: elongation factor P [Salibacteraceae bacterium]|jgi:elongation factor P|nr:elongation factor P [Salibacteraceae bacterium]|tara:strand:- start:13361 stop:13924 length:564 start_codon:yes stop_codon:yes gene_type:complete
MASTSDIKNGICLNYNHDLVQIIEFLHVKPGKGPAFVRTKIRSLTTGKVLDHTFPSGHKIDIVRIENRKYQFLYSDSQGFHFMNTNDYEQTFLDEKLINAPQFLKEGAMVDILFHADEERPLSAEVAAFVEMEITYTEPGIKGDTATNTMKPATVDTGAEVRVPLFINTGDKIKVDTRTGVYSERVK